MKCASYAIDVKQVCKRFKAIQALDGVSFTVYEGNLFCILGPNGAGKTTLLRILTTVTRPDSGSILLGGYNVHSNLMQVRQLIGVVAQENHFDRYLTIWHNLTLHAEMHGIEKKEAEHRIKDLLHQVNLYDRRFSMPDEFSGGMQRRIALIRALIHKPVILFLDEPTTGLDPHARLDMWQTIEQFKQSSTVILTTHYMEEADRLADEIMMLNYGRVVTQGTPKILKQNLSPLNTYELVLNNPKAKEYYTQLAHLVADYKEISSLTVLDDFRLELKMINPESVKTIVNAIQASDIYSLGHVQANLEDVFLSITGRVIKSEDS